MNAIHFEVRCKFGKLVRVTVERWQHAMSKHPEMRGREDDVRRILEDPDEIRCDLKNSKAHRYHGKFDDHYARVAVKFLDDEGFMITAFPETKKGGGKVIWRK